MKLKLILIVFGFVLVYFANPTFAQADDKVVVLHTKSGKLVMEFFPDDAPNHVANFINLTENGFYDRTIFHRVIEDFMIQGGDPLTKPATAANFTSRWGTGDPGYTIDAEFNDIKHNRGIVSMARSADPNSAGSQFFIVHKNSNFLDGQYTIFGRLITQESFETLDKIATLETAPNNIPFDWGKGEILKTEVVERSEILDLLQLGEPERVTESPPQTFDKKYSSEEFGFSIEFPEGWSVQEIDNPNPIIPDVAAVEPKTEGLPSSISILVEDTNGRSIEQFFDEWKNQYLQSSIDSGLLEIKSTKKTTINGLETIISDVEGQAVVQNGTIKIKYREATISGPEKFYKISYSAIKNEFENNLDKYENTLDSFKLLSEDPTSTDGGGCLIATATFDSELALQVQQLRETRDNILLNTDSGRTFLTSFNQIYYSFSPTIADWERQNPFFKETVRIVITPLLTSLSILNFVEIDSEAEMLGYGISLILVNIGMYFAAPTYLFYRLRK